MKTFSLKNTEVSRDWVIFDASDKVLGRFATKIADKLRGKDKPTFTPHVCTSMRHVCASMMCTSNQMVRW